MTWLSARREGLHRLSARDRREILRFLRGQPEHNAYLLAQVERGALVRDDVAGPFIGFWSGGALVGAFCCGSNLVLSSPVSAEALSAFAEYARRGGWQVRVAIGQDTDLGRFMDLYGRDHRPVRLERPGQLLFRLTRARHEPPDGRTGLRPAELSELEAILAADRAMVVEELGFDPFVEDPFSHREGWRRRIREGRAWVIGPPGGPLVFKAEQSAVSDDAVQISGVWTHPGARGQGLARRALGELCGRLLVSAPLVTLYVHPLNGPAIAVYRRLGFELVDKVRSIWFEAGRAPGDG